MTARYGDHRCCVVAANSTLQAHGASVCRLGMLPPMPHLKTPKELMISACLAVLTVSCRPQVPDALLRHYIGNESSSRAVRVALTETDNSVVKHHRPSPVQCFNTSYCVVHSKPGPTQLCGVRPLFRKPELPACMQFWQGESDEQKAVCNFTDGFDSQKNCSIGTTGNLVFMLTGPSNMEQ